MGGDILLAWVIDLTIGDPPFLRHPVQLIGSFITAAERIIRRYTKSNIGLMFSGALVTVVTVTCTYLITWLIIDWLSHVTPWLGRVARIWLLSTTISVKGLGEAARDIYRPLATGDLDAARKNLARVVGRDTENLNVAEIARGAIETVAENTSDGCIAPIFYGFLGGAPAAMAYKAVNTLDSMLGYRNERYLYFGRVAARVDDLFNFIPARLTALLIVLAALISGKDWQQGWRIMLRDARKHPSPNSGYPEAAMAGSLQIRLGGLNYYGGVASFRAYMGDPLKPLEANLILDAIRLMRLSTALAVLTGVSLYLILNTG